MEPGRRGLPGTRRTCTGGAPPTDQRGTVPILRFGKKGTKCGSNTKQHRGSQSSTGCNRHRNPLRRRACVAWRAPTRPWRTPHRMQPRRGLGRRCEGPGRVSPAACTRRPGRAGRGRGALHLLRSLGRRLGARRGTGCSNRILPRPLGRGGPAESGPPRPARHVNCTEHPPPHLRAQGTALHMRPRRRPTRTRRALPRRAPQSPPPRRPPPLGRPATSSSRPTSSEWSAWGRGLGGPASGCPVARARARGGGAGRVPGPKKALAQPGRRGKPTRRPASTAAVRLQNPAVCAAHEP